MKLNLKQTMAISWAWYFVQIIFWICLAAFFIFGVFILMSSKTTDKEEMQGDAGAAVVGLLFIFFPGNDIRVGTGLKFLDFIHF